MVHRVSLGHVGVQVDHRSWSVDLLTKVVERVLRICHLEKWRKVLGTVPPACTADCGLVLVSMTPCI